ncbi:hypothetical protein ACVWOM_30230 [Pseudomonas aeruginosa]
MKELPGIPVVKTLPSNAGGDGSIPVQETNISHAAGCSQNFKIIIIFEKSSQQSDAAGTITILISDKKTKQGLEGLEDRPHGHKSWKIKDLNSSSLS